MDTVELEAKLRSAYEWGRWRRATWRALLLSVPVTLLVGLSPRPVLALTLGVCLVLGSLTLWWRGQRFGQAVLPGLLAGFVPFLFASIAMQCGPGCMMGGHCVPWCVPACAAGGGMAAMVIARFAPRTPDATHYWMSAAAVTSLAGALGCSCYSLMATGALMLAFVSVSVPAFALSRRQAS